MDSSRDELRRNVKRRLRIKLTHKDKIPVLLQKHDGTVLEGSVFVAVKQRILDTMNTDEPFLPFETVKGKFLLINKSAIACVEPFDQERMAERRGRMSESESPPSPTQPSGSVAATACDQDLERRRRRAA